MPHAQDIIRQTPYGTNHEFISRIFALMKVVQSKGSMQEQYLVTCDQNPNSPLEFKESQRELSF